MQIHFHCNYNYEYEYEYKYSHTTLHYTPQRDTTLHYYTSLHFTTLHYASLQLKLQHQLHLHYMTLHHSTTLHSIALQLHYTILHYITLHSTALRSLHLQLQTQLQLPYFRLRYITLHYPALHVTRPLRLYNTTANALHYLITPYHNYNSTTLQLKLQLRNTTLHPAVVGEMTTATIATTPKNTTPTTFQSISRFALPSVNHNIQPISYRFPNYAETSATALCGTSGNLI